LKRSLSCFSLIVAVIAGMVANPSWLPMVSAQVSMTAITASSIKDFGGVPLASGKITFTPGDNYGNPIAATGAFYRSRSCYVVNGAITTATDGTTCQVVDALASNPTVCYKVTLFDSVQGQAIQTPGQGCAQPTGASWSYDSYTPNMGGAVLVQAGPAGAAATIAVHSVTTGTPGSPASVTNSGTSSAAQLDFVIPAGNNGTNGTNGTNGANGISSLPQLAAVRVATPGGVNLFNAAGVTAGYYLNGTTGATTASASWSISPYIPCNTGGSMATSAAVGGSGAGYAFYDQTLTFVTGGSNTAVTAGGSITCPSTAAYVRISLLSSAVNYEMFVNGTVLPSAYVGFATQDTYNAAYNNVVAQNTSLTAHVTYQNLFNQATVSVGALKTNGTIDSTQSSDSVSANIPVAGFATVICNKTLTVSGGYAPVWFDANGTLLSAFSSTVTAGTPISVPQYAAYLRVYWVTTQNATAMLVNGSTLPTSYLAYNRDSYLTTQIATGAATYANTYQSTRVGPYINLYNYQSLTLAAGALKTNGTVDATQTGYVTSDYMPVSGLSAITNNNAIACGGGYCGLWYDSAFNILSQLGAVSAGATTSVPAGAAYLRIYTAAYDGSVGLDALPLMIIAGSTLPPGYIPFTPLDSLYQQNANSGTIGFWGDSITNQYAWWQNKVLIRTGLKYGWKDSQNGRRTDQMLNAYSNNTPTGINQFVASQSTNTGTLGNTLTQDIANVTVMLIFTGTNDYPLASSNPGSTASTAWDGSLYGAYKGLLETLQSANPTMRIVLVGPYYQVGQTDPYCTVTRAAGLWAAQQHGIPYLDLMTTSGVNAQNYTYLLQSDHIHPLQGWANYRLGPQIADFIKRLL
jgi:hypothetical protein